LKYRSFGKKLDWQVSALGFGAMRLPIMGNDASKIDEQEATRMIRYAIDQGVNYIDTAYVYHRGNSETFLGKVLRDGYREKIRLATKMPTWQVKSEQDMDACLDTQLRRLDLDHVDFYLLHGLNGERFQRLKELNVLGWAEKKMEQGKFKHLGFSFHDEYEAFKKIVDSYDGWTLCQIQYNYVDAKYQAGTRGLKYAASKGLAVVIMEPIAGGRLAFNPPTQVQEIWNSAEAKRSLAEWALMWVWNHPEVSVVLSGMSTMQQVVENVESADRSGPEVLSKKELQLITKVAKKYKELGFVGCSGCRYCLPCPEGVSIPDVISLYNEYYVRSDKDEVKKKYWEHITPESQAKRCKRCGTCEQLCPQHLPVKDIMSRATMIFEQQTS
jgi:predicted aldo/keto reductase-like oxidoreductase